MYSSYFKTGFRNLQRNGGYALINIGGLAIGMLVAMLVGLWVYDELSFNQNHANYKQIAQVMTNVSIDGDTVTYAALPFPAAAELRAQYAADFDAVAATWSGERIITYENKAIMRRGGFVDSAFPGMLTLDMQSGDYRSFDGPSTILLSSSLATAMFGDESPLNKDVSINNELLRVVGVYKNIPQNSRFHAMEYMAPASLLFLSGQSLDNWRSSAFEIFVTLNHATTFDGASKKIRDVVFAHTQEATMPRLFLHPMARWHLYEFRNGHPAAGRLELVTMMGIIGVLILMLACINFINLSTAQSGKRAREVGVRKTLGSARLQLINQFLCESFLIACLALILSVAILTVVLPWFNDFTSKQIAIPWTSAGLWIFIVGFTIAVSLMAGSYPALFLSSFNAVKVLKGTASGGRAGSTPRRLLVITQFTVSIMLIIGTLVVFNQIQYVKDRPIGYSKDGLITIPLSTPEIMQGYDALRTELLKTNAVSQVSRSSSPTTDIWSSADNLSWDGKDPHKQFLFGTISIDPYYNDVVSWQIKEGRNFSAEMATDTLAFVLNEAAVEQMSGLGEPIGKHVRWHGKDWQIIGVVRDMIMTSPFASTMPTVFMIDNRERPFNVINIRLNPRVPTSASLQDVEAALKKVAPSTPFDYKFADQEYDAKFSAEENVSRLAVLFTIVAITISCIGLLGLVSYVAERRAKEIGIRKIMGASVAQVWRLLSYEFFTLILVASFLAIPLANYVMSRWLMKFDYRIALTWQVFAVSCLSASLLTLLTITFHATRAALTNPVKNLRSE